MIIGIALKFCLNIVLEIDSKNFAALIGKAQCYEDIGKAGDAIPIYKFILKDNTLQKQYRDIIINKLKKLTK